MSTSTAPGRAVEVPVAVTLQVTPQTARAAVIALDGYLRRTQERSLLWALSGVFEQDAASQQVVARQVADRDATCEGVTAIIAALRAVGEGA